MSIVDGAYISGSSIVIPSTGGIQYGPYKAFETGVYLVTINGSNLNNVKTIEAYYGGTVTGIKDHLEYNLQKLTSTQIVYKVNVTTSIPDLEFVLRNSNSGDIRVDNISVQKSSNFYYTYTGDCANSMCGFNGAITSGTSIVLTGDNQFTYGPYKPLSKGNYEITIYGTNLDKISKLDIFENGLYTSGEITSTSSTMSKYKFTLTEDYTSKGAEVYISGSDGNTITIDKYKITKIND